MENVSAIILKGKANLNGASILFKDVKEFMTDTCKKAGISNICVEEDNYKTDEFDDALFLFEDMPFVDADTIKYSYNLHKENQNSITFIKTDINAPACGGWSSLAQLRENSPKNDDGSLKPDILSLIESSTGKSNIYLCPNKNAEFTVKNARDLLKANKLAKQAVIDRHLDNGVIFLSLDSIIIGEDVIIESGATILPGTILKGKTTIGMGSVIGPNSLVENSTIAQNTKFNSSQCYNSTIGSNVSIGPFCHIRPNSNILDGAHLGDFVEIKNSTIGENTHVSHLTYVGDSDVGKRVNFGCGVVTVNYNGVSKARCTIGDDAFIGCNTNLVAPVTVGNKGYTAAGSTITDNVPDEAMAIARARQVNKEGYNKKLRGIKA